MGVIGSEQVQQQLAHHGAFAADSDTSPREVLASALGNRLGRMVVGGEKLFSCEFRSYVIQKRMLTQRFCSICKEVMLLAKR